MMADEQLKTQWSLLSGSEMAALLYTADFMVLKSRAIKDVLTAMTSS